MADEEKKAEVFLYDLTKMTGKSAQAGRSVVVATIEMRRRTLVASVISLIPALLAAGMFLPLLGIWSTIIGGVVFGALMFFFLVRQRRGLQLAQWRGWADKRRARTDVVIQCNRVIDPRESSARTVVRSSRPNTLRRRDDDGDLTDEVLALA